MPYKIAGIDVHKRMLHVVVSDVQVDGEYNFTLVLDNDRVIEAAQPRRRRSMIL